MHYGPKAFSANGLDTITPVIPNVTIGQRAQLSERDRLTLSFMYPAPKNQEFKTKEPLKDAKEKEGKDTTKEGDKGHKDGGKDKDGDKGKDHAGKELEDPQRFAISQSYRGGKAVADRLAGLEQAVSQLIHFIPPELRPDLQASALNNEPVADDAYLQSMSAQLARQADDAKAAKDTKDSRDFHKYPDR
jgi:hypothetical protein